MSSIKALNLKKGNQCFMSSSVIKAYDAFQVRRVYFDVNEQC